MNGLFAFLGSTAGRWVRSLAGLALILIGIFAIGGTGGWILAIVGLLPLFAGLLDICLFAPLAGLPFSGERLRAGLRR